MNRGEGAGYAFGGKRSEMIKRRLAYIRKHGAKFLLNNEPAPADWPKSFTAPEEDKR